MNPSRRPLSCVNALVVLSMLLALAPAPLYAAPFRPATPAGAAVITVLPAWWVERVGQADSLSHAPEAALPLPTLLISDTIPPADEGDNDTIAPWSAPFTVISGTVAPESDGSGIDGLLTLPLVVTGTFTARGGQVGLPSGRLRIVAPPGAVTQTTVVTLTLNVLRALEPGQLGSFV